MRVREGETAQGFHSQIAHSGGTAQSMGKRGTRISFPSFGKVPQSFETQAGPFTGCSAGKAQPALALEETLSREDTQVPSKPVKPTVNVISHEGNANEPLCAPVRTAAIFKAVVTSRAGQGVEKVDRSDVAGGDVTWSGRSGKYFGSFL